MNERCSKCGWTRGQVLDAALAMSVGVRISKPPVRHKHDYQPVEAALKEGEDE
jgi:hypothetical protein